MYTTIWTLQLSQGTGFIKKTIGRSNPLPYGNASIITLSNGITIDTRYGEPDLPVLFKIGDNDRPGYYIVQFKGPVYPHDRLMLKDLGGQIMGYLSNYAYIVRLDESKKSRLTVSGRVQWVGFYQPAYKTSPELSTVTGVDTLLILLFFPEDLARTIEKIEAMSGTILDPVVSSENKMVKVVIDTKLISEIAHLNEVAWIQLWRPAEPVNAQAQWVGQDWTKDVRRIWDMGLRGEGQVINTCDTGIDLNHDMFRDDDEILTGWGDYPDHRKVIGYKPGDTDAGFGDNAYFGFHGTHTAGTAGGDDEPVGGVSPNDGMAPKCKIYFMDCASATRFTLDPDLNLLFEPPYTGNRGGAARISSNSWSYKTNGNYDVMAMTLDQFVWNHKDFLVCVANGNIPNGDIHSGSPACSKNCLAVGSVGDGLDADMAADYSTPGPAADGRLKPAVVAPGILYSAKGGTRSNYTKYEGTSMASPCAASFAVMVRQYLTDGFYPGGQKDSLSGFNPSAALLKALIINSTDNDIFNHTIPDVKVGWGRIDLDSVLYFPGDQRKLLLTDETVGCNTGDEQTYDVTVDDPALPLRITLVWSDYPGVPWSGLVLVNDLDLTVIGPTGATFKGNNYKSGESQTGGAYDSLNVEECVRVNKPEAGDWQIKVSGRNIPQGPQPYALVITGGVGGRPEIACAGYELDGVANAQLPSGDTVDFKVYLSNTSTWPSVETKAVLWTSVPWITILDSISLYSTIFGYDTAAGDGFRLWADSTTNSGSEIPFTLVVEGNGGAYTDTLELSVRTGVSEIPVTAFGFEMINPTPFSKKLTIGYGLKRNGEVRVEVYDITGRSVARLFAGQQKPGRYQLQWDGCDNHGQHLGSGIYFLRLQVGDYSTIKKIVLVDTKM